MRTRGFTIIELIITITIMGILLTLAAVGLSTTQVKARDDERRTDVEAIKTHLETIYTSGISSAAPLPTTTNLLLNPSAESGVSPATGSGASATVTQSSVWKAKGSYSFQVAGNAASTDSFMYIVDGIPGSFQNGMEAGKTYTASGTFYQASPQTGTLDSRARRIQIYYQTPSGYTAVSSSQPANVAGATRLSVTASIPANASEAFVRFYNGSSTGNGSVYWDGLILSEGSTAYEPLDGSSGGWSWLGTANTSRSTGPVLPTGVPGGYPSTVLTSSSTVLGAVLSDADTKILLPPGVTSVTSGFIIATNNTQSTSGVTPQPTTSQYVYQPLDANGNVCTVMSECRKFNLYYRLEGDNTVYMVRSKNQ